MSEKVKYFTVIAGRKEPAPLEMGFLDKQTGMPKGQTQQFAIAVGALMLPNYSRVWARRVKTNGKTNGSVAVTDKEYSGKLEFLKWGENGGELIEIRFMSQCSSLDKAYQDQILKLAPKEDDAFIVLNQGLNDFDESIEPLKVEVLKRHTLNLNNESRDPSNNEWAYIVYDASKRKSTAQTIAIRHEAEAIVLENQDNGDALKVLATIYGLDARLQSEVILEQLFAKVQKDPSNFLYILQEYKKDAYEKILGLHQEEVLDVTSEEGSIGYYTDGKKDILISGIENAKGKEKLMWLVENILVPEVFEAIKKLEGLTLEVANQ